MKHQENQTVTTALGSSIFSIKSVVRSLINNVMGRAQGVDISHWDLGFNPDTATERIDFAIMKLTEGTAFVDSLADEMWTGVQKVPVRGGYHYGRSGMSWQAQATHYLNIASRYNLHFHVYDLEEIGNTYSDTFFADVRRWIDHVRSKTGKRVLLYTNLSTWELFKAAIKRLYTDWQVWLDELEIWIAWPSTIAANPPVPKWTLWQIDWTGDPKKWGTLSYCDVNVFNGTVDELYEWAGATGEIPQPPPNGGTMRYKAKAIANSTKTRPNHNTVTDFNPVRYHSAGTKFEGDLVWVADAANKEPSQYVGDTWLDVKKINGVDVTPCWVAIVHQGKEICTLVDNGPTTPPPSNTKPTVTLFVDAGEDYNVESDGSGMIKLVPK